MTALAGTNTTVLTDSEEKYAIDALLANAVADTDGLVNGADSVTVTVG